MAAAKKTRVDFRIHAPDAEQVCLAGSFNDWDPTARTLRKGKDATWKTWTTLPPGEHEYRFVVDGEWIEDPTVDQREANPFGSYNSVVRL